MQGTCISLDIGIEDVLLVMDLFSLCVCACMPTHVFTSVYVSYHCYCIHTGEYEMILYIDNVEAQ